MQLREGQYQVVVEGEQFAVIPLIPCGAIAFNLIQGMVCPPLATVAPVAGIVCCEIEGNKLI